MDNGLLKTKDVVAGLGEIGKPLQKLISKNTITVGYDINGKLVDKNQIMKYEELETRFLHVCIPFNKKFIKNVIQLNVKFNPSSVVIHSTLEPHTTTKLQEKLSIPVIYSATRGVHKRMLSDLKKYTKFYGIEKSAPRRDWASKSFVQLMKKSGVKTKQVSNPITLELSKIICDTSYLGWLINYSQISNIIAMKHGVDFDEMWSFADEIHKFLGNRPKMFPGYIGGHCVIPNLDLIKSEELELIRQMNELYAKKIPNSRSIAKKYSAKLNR
jgi:UDP-N-acetyl-D-mannosaminuronate dehydrogenase